MASSYIQKPYNIIIIDVLILYEHPRPLSCDLRVFEEENGSWSTRVNPRVTSLSSDDKIEVRTIVKHTVYARSRSISMLI